MQRDPSRGPELRLEQPGHLRFATDRFDGMTLYQCYLVANILAEKNGLYVPQVLVLYRRGNAPLFGQSESERGKFTPETHTPEGSLFFLRGLLEIARYVEDQRGVPFYRRVLQDVGNYSYPFLAIQSDKSLGVFTRYAVQAARAGLWRSPMFYAYYAALVLFGVQRVDRWIERARRRLGRTPALGGFYQGVKRS